MATGEIHPGERGDGAPEQRTVDIRSVVFDFLARKNKGEPVDPAEYEQAHSHLMPELHDALQRGLRRLRQASEVERERGGGDAPPPPFQDNDATDNRPVRPRP